MRAIEMLLLLFNLFTFLVFAVPRLHAVRWMRYIVFITLTLAVVQILVEGPRWQMVPAYVLAGLFLVIWVTQRLAPVGGDRLRDRRAAGARSAPCGSCRMGPRPLVGVPIRRNL